MTMIRSFLAIPLPPVVQQRLGCLQQELRQQVPELRPSGSENLHLTLAFLGDQTPEMLDRIGVLMLSIGRSTPVFAVRLRGVGSFPPGRRPRLLWLGVEPQWQLLALQVRLAEGLAELGLPRETRPYRPHLTLGRLLRPPLKRGIVEPFKEHDCGRMEVERMVLFSSQLTPQGALHHPLYEVELNG